MRSIAPVLLALAALAVGCADPTTIAPADDGAVMSATVGDRGLVMRSLTHDRLELRFFVSGTTAIDPPNENILLSFDSLTAPGKIPITPSSTRVQVRYRRRSNATSSEEFKGIDGLVTVEELSETRASGTFSFTAQIIGGTERVTVSEGSFTTSLR